MKETVKPAIMPARAWPRVGSLRVVVSAGFSRVWRAEGVALRRREGVKTFSWRRRR